MSEIWPYDVKLRQAETPASAIRPFKCLLLMPFEDRFDHIAGIIEKTVRETVGEFSVHFNMELPRINRLDWITSTNVIQHEIWQEIKEADLIFCDITSYNPNVMFELGVCAGWKKITQIVLLKDRSFKQPSAFDIAPIRYTEYDLTGVGVLDLQEKIKKHVLNVLIAFPDLQGDSPKLTLPVHIDFKENRDDLRIFTPPLAHRRVINGALEFGSRTHFPHSWASVGKTPFLNFQIEFSARFSNPIPGAGYIGVV